MNMKNNASTVLSHFPFPNKGNNKWGIRFSEKGTTSHKVYDQKVVVFSADGTKLGSFNGSSTPNPFKPKNSNIKGTDAYPFVKAGTYNIKLGSHRGKPALVVNGNVNVPTTALNPNFPNQGSFANYIHVHWGYSNTWKGSAGCPTIGPTEWKKFLSVIPSGDGFIIIP